MLGAARKAFAVSLSRYHAAFRGLCCQFAVNPTAYRVLVLYCGWDRPDHLSRAMECLPLFSPALSDFSPFFAWIQASFLYVWRKDQIA